MKYWMSSLEKILLVFLLTFVVISCKDNSSILTQEERAWLDTTEPIKIAPILP